MKKVKTYHILFIVWLILAIWYVYKMGGIAGCIDTGFFEFNKGCKP